MDDTASEHEKHVEWKQDSESESEQDNEDGLQCLTSSTLLHVDRDDDARPRKDMSRIDPKPRHFNGVCLRQNQETPQFLAPNIQLPAKRFAKETSSSMIGNYRGWAGGPPVGNCNARRSRCKSVGQAPEEAFEKYKWQEQAEQLDEVIQSLGCEALSTCLRDHVDIQDYSTFTKDMTQSAWTVQKSIVRLHIKVMKWTLT